MTTNVLFTPLEIIEVPNGNVMHVLKESDSDYRRFGEAYLSFVNQGAIKGWKRHLQMTCNLVVGSGCIKFRVLSPNKEIQSYLIGTAEGAQYGRLTIPPGHWFAFGGVSEGTSCLLNIADIPHDPKEAEKLSLDALDWKW